MKKLFLFFVLFMLSPIFAEDPDYGNDSASAELITPDSGRLFGVLSSSSDEDWFRVSNPGVTYYRLSFNNTEYNWKYIQVLTMDDLDVSTQAYNIGAYNNSATNDFFIETEDDIYIRIYSGTGNYSIDLAVIGTIPEDSYSNQCASPTQLIVDSGFVEGTITHFAPILQLPADEDWFEFETTALHTYRVLLQDVDNDELNFQIYNDNCEYILQGRDVTIVSLNGESYKIRVWGSPNSKGEYYRVSVSDIAQYTDDYPNFKNQAYEIDPDGTEIHGRMDYVSTYNSDKDWFKFTPTPYTLYRIYFNNLEQDWKYLSLYQDNAIGVEVGYDTWGVYNNQQYRDYFVESGMDIYLMFQYDIGNYWFSVVPLGTYPPDDYSDSCQSPTQLIVDEAPVEGTITRPNPENGTPIDVDWFKFTVEPLHKYQITLTQSYTANVYFSLYNSNCQFVGSGSTNQTFVAPEGMGDEYKLYVYGSTPRLGEYYTLSIEDLGQEIDDYPNSISTANNTLITSLDGTEYWGNIDYAANVQYDVDVCQFLAPLDGTYSFTFDNAATGWMYMRVWKETANPGDYQDVGTLGNYYSSGPQVLTINLTAGVHYIQFFIGNSTEIGPYVFSIVSPEPRCGDLAHPYPVGDANKDCVVNMLDIAEMGLNWLIDNRPEI